MEQTQYPKMLKVKLEESCYNKVLQHCADNFRTNINVEIGGSRISGTGEYITKYVKWMYEPVKL